MIAAEFERRKYGAVISWSNVMDASTWDEPPARPLRGLELSRKAEDFERRYLAARNLELFPRKDCRSCAAAVRRRAMAWRRGEL